MLQWEVLLTVYRIYVILIWNKNARPQMALAYRLDASSQSQKKSRFPGPNPLPFALVMDAARIKSMTHIANASCGIHISCGGFTVSRDVFTAFSSIKGSNWRLDRF